MGKYYQYFMFLLKKIIEAECFPTPIVYDNTDIAKKIDFNEFRKGYRESTTTH